MTWTDQSEEMRSVRSGRAQQDQPEDQPRRHPNNYGILGYLGVLINHSGSIAPQLNKIQLRSKYLRANLGYYVQHLTFENQALLWQVYVKPYFTYTAPVVLTQTATMKRRFHSMWRNSFKEFMGLPAALPGAALQRIFRSTEDICE